MVNTSCCRDDDSVYYANPAFTNDTVTTNLKDEVQGYEEENIYDEIACGDIVVGEAKNKLSSTYQNSSMDCATVNSTQPSHVEPNASKAAQYEKPASRKYANKPRLPTNDSMSQEDEYVLPDIRIENPYVTQDETLKAENYHYNLPQHPSSSSTYVNLRKTPDTD